MQNKKVKSNTRKITGQIKADKKTTTFFGKLPGIEDGLNFQKKIRREWK